MNPTSHEDGDKNSGMIGPIPGGFPNSTLGTNIDPALQNPEATPYDPEQITAIMNALNGANERKGEDGYGEFYIGRYLLSLQKAIENNARPYYLPKKHGPNEPQDPERTIGYLFSDPNTGETISIKPPSSHILPRELRDNPTLAELFQTLITDPEAPKKVLYLQGEVTKRIQEKDTRIQEKDTRIQEKDTTEDPPQKKKT
jgi:hypothetical protein